MKLGMLACLAAGAMAFNINAKTNIAAYWAQGVNENTLAHYCQQNDVYTIAILSFLEGFPTGSGVSYPTLSLPGHCDSYFSDWNKLLHCPSVAEDIKYCQAQGVQVMLSLGGGTATSYFESEAVAKQFAHTLWDMFLGGTSDHRPFDSAVLDGIDLDIEHGTHLYYAAFVNELRAIAKANGGVNNHDLWIASAPQCPYPDAQMGPDGNDWAGRMHNNTAFTDAWFDWVMVQFYNNNPCNVGTSGFRSGKWSAATWNEWAAAHNTRLLIGTLLENYEGETGFVEESVLLDDLTFASSLSQFSGCGFWNMPLSESLGRASAVAAHLKTL